MTFVRKWVLEFSEIIKERGFLMDNDTIMADKGFRIEKQLSEIGLKLNIPPFSTQASQMSASDVALTRKIAKQPNSCRTYH